LIEPYFAPHRPNTKAAYEHTIIEKGNWKLVWENSREYSHFAVNHPALCRTFPEAPRSDGAEKGPEILAHCGKCEAQAFHLVSAWTPQFSPLNGRAFGDGVSPTMSSGPI
jgi:phenylpropionate dioxygenase-like ring-hydroxylating dioxygenase large terminal subunit